MIATEKLTTAPEPKQASKSSPFLYVMLACGLAVAAGGLAYTFFTHQAGGNSQANGTTVAPQITVTATSTIVAVVTQTPAPEFQQPVAGGQSRPADWQSYQYDGPSNYDVCAAPNYPLAGPMPPGTMPSPGTPEYFTLLSVQAALRALNYGSPQLVIADAQFTEETATALAGFQQRHKVPVTSEIDAATWGAISSAVHYWMGTCP